MRNYLLAGCALLFLSLNISAQKLTKIWETDTVFDVPESVLFTESVLYVSNVNGKPLEKNGQGYISKVSLSGEIINKKWATGINAPKGMGTYHDELYVSDIDRILIIDLATGKTKKEIAVPEGQFLNDVAVSGSGKVYISDMKTNTIYTLENDVAKKLIVDERLNYVNGLYCDGETLFAGTGNGVFKLNASGEILEHYIKETGGGIDGLEMVSEGQFLKSDWAGKVHLVSTDNEPLLLLNFESDSYNAADIGFDKDKQIMYLPSFFGNSVAAYQLKL